MSAAIGHGSESKSTDWQPAHSTAYRCHYLFKSSPSSPSFCQRISRRLSKASRARRRHASVSAQASMNEAPSKTDISSLKGQSLSTVLLAHLGNAQGADLYRIFMSLQGGVKSLAHLLSRAGMDNLSGVYEGASESAERDQAQKLDVISNDIIKAAFKDSGCICAIASEEEDDVELIDSGNAAYSLSMGSSDALRQAAYDAVFDPLDGSRNIDAGIPTGTIFGIYRASDRSSGEEPGKPCLQQGRHLLAAGYALYSSATTLVLSWGDGVHGFTLDRGTGDFVLTYPAMRIPARGQIYSLNDARYYDWPEGLRSYIDTIRQGKGQNPKQYSARYICSLVADFHRTLFYGGIAANPRSHLRLVYEANPLSFISEQAGGRGSDGKRRILDIQPGKLHQRLPLFLGSPEDIAELESYGDVQQIVAKKYTI